MELLWAQCSELEDRDEVCTAVHRSTGLLDIVHIDVWGPTKHASLGGHRFFVLFVDEFSRQNWVYTLRHKGKVLEVFVKWKKLMENQTDRKIKAWFKVAISAADSTGTETHRSRHLGSISSDTRKTLHKKLKFFWKNHDKSKKNVKINFYVSHVQNNFFQGQLEKYDDFKAKFKTYGDLGGRFRNIKDFWG